MNQMRDMAAQAADNFWQEYGADEWSDAVVAAMKLGGVDHLFFVSGSEVAYYQEAIAKAQARGWPAPRLVTMMHESVALCAAQGASMVTGKPAATAAHVDVGTMHYGGAMHNAWRSGAPVLITAGTGPRAFPGSMRGARDHHIQWLQEPRDQGEILRQYTKADHRMEHQDNPGLMVSRLLQIAMSEPQGPVYLSLPRETAMLPMPGVTRFPTRDELGLARGAWPDPDDAKTIARWLVKSENPVVIAERLGHDPAAVAELQRLAELLALPVTDATNSDRINFPFTHPLHNSGPEPRDADVVLVFETVHPWQPGRGSPAPEAKIAWVSQDPVMSRYKTMEFRADLWLPATPRNVARAIHDAATGMLDKSDMARIAARRARLERSKKESAARDEALAREAGGKQGATARWVGYQLGRILEPDTVLVNDALSNASFVQMYSGRDRTGTYFRCGSSMGGWGPGAGFGAKLAAPDRDVVLACGDGFFVFGTPLAALWAARQHKAPFLSVIFVNAGYSTGTTGLRHTYPEGHAVSTGNYDGGTFDPPPDFAKLAEAAGGYGENVSESKDVGPALERGLKAVHEGSPAVVAVRIPNLA